MIDVEKYLSVPYLDGGRTLQGSDCWGFVLAVREELGLPSLPSIGLTTRHTPLAMSRDYENVSSGLVEGSPRDGAIAAVFRGRLMAHVGIVITIDGRLACLETNPASGPRWSWVAAFNDRYLRVIYYHDREGIPEQADA